MTELFYFIAKIQYKEEPHFAVDMSHGYVDNVSCSCIGLYESLHDCINSKSTLIKCTVLT